MKLVDMSAGINSSKKRSFGFIASRVRTESGSDRIRLERKRPCCHKHAGNEPAHVASETLALQSVLISSLRVLTRGRVVYHRTRRVRRNSRPQTMNGHTHRTT